jgi:hypothetical protein
MKNILYYLFLLIFLVLLSGFLIFGRMDSMSMPQMLGVGAFLVLYTIAMSFVGEQPNADEREILHRHMSNRAGLIAGMVLFSLGILYQLFISHMVDYWLLMGLIAINLTKIVSLIYLENKK